MGLSEPRIHSHITDCLEAGHPLAEEQVECDVPRCRVLLHAANNECMQTWVETGIGNYCLCCFAHFNGEVLEDRMGLPTPPKES